MEFKLPVFVSQIIEKFQKAGFEIYIVGGSVRDLLLGRTVSDWDFTTKATPEEILKIFPTGFYDNEFGTVGITDGKKEVYEITTFRREEKYSDRRHPDKVTWGETIQEDLSRRDFTINAMALRLTSFAQGKLSKKKNDFQLIDPFEGQKDLKKREIKAVGDPIKRFNEDALRLIRAVRIATELGFNIETKTFQAIKDLASLITQIAKERVKKELLKILASPYPDDGMMLLRNSGLLEYILPELEKAFEIPQKSPGRHHLYDVGTHSLLSLKFCPSPDPLVRLATLIHDLGKVSTFKKDKESITFYNHEMVSASLAKNLARSLRFSKKEEEKLVNLVRWHQFTVDERQTDKAIRRFIKNIGKENIKDMLTLRVGDRLGGGARETSWRLEAFKKRLKEVQKQPFSLNDLKIDGNEVMKVLGIGPGPRIGQILEKLFEEVVEDKEKNKKEYLLKRIKEIK